MRILIGCDTYYPMPNGASYFTQRLAAGLAKRGHAVYVITPGTKSHDEKYMREGVHVYALRSIPIPIYPDLRITPTFWVRRAIDRYVAEIRPDIVHIQNHYLTAAVVARSAQKRHIPVVGTNHFMPENLVHYLHLPKFLERRVVMLGWKHFAHIYRQLDGLTIPTRLAAQHVESLSLGLHITPISCGIDLDRFNPQNDGAYLRERYGLDAKRPTLLYVGRLVREKRLDEVIRSLPLIRKYVDVQFVIGGVGSQLDELKSLAAKLGVSGSVHFVGFVPDEDLPNLYGLADVFVMAGIAELQSIVTMEAMASGLPIVAANAVALPALVHDGENGFLFTDGKVKQLAERLQTLLSDPALQKRMGRESRRLVQTHDINSQIAAYEDFYRQVLGIAPDDHKPKTEVPELTTVN